MSFPVTAVVVGVAELAKLANNALLLYAEAKRLALATEEEIQQDFNDALVRYRSLPLPADITLPEEKKDE